MYRKEKGILVSLISLILIPGIYYLYVYQKCIAGNPNVLNDLKFWGMTFFILMPVMILILILIYIVFFTINKIVTNEEIPAVTDEMDKLIELKAIKISRRVYSLCFLLAVGSPLIGMQPWVMFVILISSCFLGGIAECTAKIYYYRKGI